jgi:hypothetical protein
VIVLLLLVIWVAALAPFVLRKLSEHQLTSSVSRFGHLAGMIGRGSSRADEPALVERPGRNPEHERRLRNKRARIRRQRRRRALAGLAGIGAFSLLFGAIPALRALWDVTIADVLLTACYLAALAYLTRLETFEREREAIRNVYPIAPRPGDLPEARAYAVAGGRASAMPRPVALRPAFRIVEAPSG